ncbi:hypothetical protein H9P43_001703 [Blastocladiella emersonii ATCC 22665]|nr:hypothetical protein H9P43_001703 [Blastocladiella emersonii ATCC 22665]
MTSVLKTVLAGTRNGGVPALARLVISAVRAHLNRVSWQLPDATPAPSQASVVAESKRSYTAYDMNAEIEVLRGVASLKCVVLKVYPILHGTVKTVVPLDGSAKDGATADDSPGGEADSVPPQRPLVLTETGSPELNAANLAYILRLSSRPAADEVPAPPQRVPTSTHAASAAAAHAPPATADDLAARRTSENRARHQRTQTKDEQCAAAEARGERPRATPRIDNRLLPMQARNDGEPAYAIVYEHDGRVYLYATPGRPRSATEQWARGNPRTQAARDLGLKRFPTFDELAEALAGAPFIVEEMYFGIRRPTVEVKNVGKSGLASVVPAPVLASAKRARGRSASPDPAATKWRCLDA